MVLVRKPAEKWPDGGAAPTLDGMVEHIALRYETATDAGAGPQVGGRARLFSWAWAAALGLLSAASPAAAAATGALPGVAAPVPGADELPLVVLDAGHGGIHTGARGVCGVWEKEVTLQVAARTAQILCASQLVRVAHTRTTDEYVSLEARSALANRLGARLLVSIHANASTTPQARGIETFFLSLTAASRRLARLARRENEGHLPGPKGPVEPLQRVLAGLSFDANHSASQQLAMRLQRGLTAQVAGRGRGVLQAPFQVLMGAQMPASLVEIGFLTHPQECVRLTSLQGQEFVARGIAAGVLAFVAEGRGDPRQPVAHAE